MALNEQHYSPGFKLMMESEAVEQSRKDKIVSEAERIAANLKEMELPDRLKSTIQAVEAYTAAQTKGVKISCGLGCAHCCFTPVTASEAEVDVLVDLIKTSGMTINESDLKKQAQKAGDLNGFWSQPTQPTKCVFLGSDSKCTVYEKRPIACRLHFVTSHPDLCKTDSEGDVKKYAATNAEVVATAYYQTARIGYLPEILYNKLHPDNEMMVSTTVWNKLVNGQDVVEDEVRYEASKVKVETDTIKMVTDGVLGYYDGRKIKLRTN